jgi:protein-disulfide isomerase
MPKERNPEMFAARRIAAFVCICALGYPLLSSAAEPSALAPREQIETIIREYLRDHPEAVVEALQEMQRRQQAEQHRRVVESIAAHQAELAQDPSSPVSGNREGRLTVVEFFDYQCQYCKRQQPELTKLLQADGDIRLVYKDLPILGPASAYAARAALAADRQGKYEPLHVALMTLTGQLTEQVVLRTAGSVGLDVSRLEKDMQDPAVSEAVERNIRLAEALGIHGTPALIIGREFVGGIADFAALQAIVVRARGK